jgi:hypothetical protein
MLRLIIISLMIFFVSCENREKDDVVARVYDVYLYQKNLEEIIPAGVSYEDSAFIADNYINNWIRQTLIYKRAEDNLAPDQKDFTDKLEDYRRSLVIYNYERELINQLLDTVVTHAQIESYYNENKQNFELKDNIIKVFYVKLSKKAPDMNKVRKWIKSTEIEDIKALEIYAYQFSENFYLDENWLLFDDLLKEIPIRTYDKEEYLKNNRYIEVEDSEYIYLVNIKGFKIKNSISPLSFEKENIRNIILNKRKILLINKMKSDIYEDALQRNDFEIFKSN